MVKNQEYGCIFVMTKTMNLLAIGFAEHAGKKMSRIALFGIKTICKTE